MQCTSELFKEVNSLFAQKRNVQHNEFVLKLYIFSKIFYFYCPSILGKVSKIFHAFCQYLGLSTIMNLIFRTVRLENFMKSCRDKLYYRTISNKIKFIFMIILFGKMSSSESLPSSGTESKIGRMNDFEKFGLQLYSHGPKKIKGSSFLCQEFCE